MSDVKIFYFEGRQASIRSLGCLRVPQHVKFEICIHVFFASIELSPFGLPVTRETNSHRAFYVKARKV